MSVTPEMQMKAANPSQGEIPKEAAPLLLKSKCS